MSSCRERVLDLFVTKDSTNYEGEFDDSFVGPVWSVDFTNFTDTHAAVIVNKATEWVTWCAGGVNDSDLAVGDLVRIGKVNTTGYTDYLTIVDKQPITQLRNGVHSFAPAISGMGQEVFASNIVPAVEDPTKGKPIQIIDHGFHNNEMVMVDVVNSGDILPVPLHAGMHRIIVIDKDLFYFTTIPGPLDVTTMSGSFTVTRPETTAGINGVTSRYWKDSPTEPSSVYTHQATTNYMYMVEPTVDGDGQLIPDDVNGTINVTQYCYRLNFAVNCTLPPEDHLHPNQDEHGRLQMRFGLRHSHNHKAITDWRERMYFPLYKVNKWLTDSGKVAVKLDHGVKSLHWIKLMGYSVFNKRQVGFQSTHEMITDDWVALHIDEFQGDVVSNNKTANGSFAVLHVGGTADNHAGAIEFHQHDPAGLHTHYFENHQSTVRNLNMRFLDRNGGPAHFGRIHLWFKVCVQHG